MKVWKRGTIVLIVAGIAALTACSSSGSPKEAFLDAIAKTSEAKTFTYKGSFTIDDIRLPEAPETAANQDVLLRAALPVLLKGAVIQVHGVVQKNPQHAELTLDAALGTGDVKLTLSIPIIVTADRIYMKVPQFPGLGIPEDIAGKFVMIDAKKLAEERGGSALLTDGSSLKLGQDALKALFDSLDEKTYFSEPKAADVKDLPAGYKADRYVRMTIDEKHADETLTAMAGKAIPQIIDLLLQNEAYMKSLQVTKDQLEAAKKDLTADKLKQTLNIEAFQVTGGISDDYLTYETGNIQVDSADAAKGMKLNVHYELARDNLDKAVKFEYELPKDAVPVDELKDLLVP